MAFLAAHDASASLRLFLGFSQFPTPASYNKSIGREWPGCVVASCFSFGNPCHLRKFPAARSKSAEPDASTMDKIARLKEILALDPRNSFARYGIAMELASRGEIAAALAEFDTLLTYDPDYTAGYFMSAQTLEGAGRKNEAIERLKAGIGCAARRGNSHALSEMQAMLDELER
jgi:tetratricopeptide (TPR) repeat protein